MIIDQCWLDQISINSDRLQEVDIGYLYIMLFTEVEVSMGFIILSNELQRLINAIETVPRYKTSFYYETLLPSNMCIPLTKKV